MNFTAVSTAPSVFTYGTTVRNRPVFLYIFRLHGDKNRGIMQLSWRGIILTLLSVVSFHAADARAGAAHEAKTAGRPGIFSLAQATSGDELSERTEFDIPPQPLGSAITAFADQANYRLLVPSEMTEGRPAPA